MKTPMVKFGIIKKNGPTFGWDMAGTLKQK